MLLLFLILTVSNNDINAQHATIKHYDQISVETCGISFIGKENSNCFKWLRMVAKDSVLAPIKYGRPAQDGEFPWNVFIDTKYYDRTRNSTRISRCSGSLINKSWIITAGHCVKPNVEYTKAFIGYKDYPLNSTRNKFYLVGRQFKHPSVDIGLMKLNSILDFTKNERHYLMNSLCLPTENITNTGVELAVMCGWGKVDDNQYNVDKLQAAYVRLLPPYLSAFDDYGMSVLSQPNSRDPRGCSGDSGAALIQYVGGRAVLIDTYKGRRLQPGQPMTDCSDGPQVFYRIPYFMSWITSTIAQN